MDSLKCQNSLGEESSPWEGVFSSFAIGGGQFAIQWPKKVKRLGGEGFSAKEVTISLTLILFKSKHLLRIESKQTQINNNLWTPTTVW